MAVTTVEIKEQWQADEANRSPEERGPGAHPRSQMERQRPNRGIASCARCLRPFRDSEPGYACSSGRPFAQRNRRSRAFADHPRTAQADLVNVRFGADSVAKVPKCRATNFSPKRQNKRQSSIDVSSGPPPKSPVS